MRRALKVAWPVLVVLLWLVATAAFLELAATGFTLLSGLGAQAYLSRDLDGPMPLMRPATPEEQQQVLNKGILASAPAPDALVAAPSNPAPKEDNLESRFWRLYCHTPKDERDAQTALAGEAWHLVRPDGEVEASFGLPDAVGSFRFPETAQGLSPGEGRIIQSPSSPLWEAEVQRIAATNPEDHSARDIYHYRLTHLGASLPQLEELYRGISTENVLVHGFILRPNQTGVTTSDQFGFPNLPVVLPKPDHVFRIVCFGGSTTYESDHGNPRTTAFLQQLFENEFPGWKVEVINCGIASATSIEMCLHARDYLRYQPDLLLYYEGINDALRTIANRKLFLPRWRALLLKSSVLRHWCNPLLFLSDKDFRESWRRSTRVNLLGISMAAKEAGVPLAASSMAYPDKGQLSLRERLFVEWNARTSWSQGMATFSVITHLLDMHNEMLKQLCGEKGWGYLPLAENYHHGMAHFRDVCHFSPEGMQERARLLHLWLKPWVAEAIASRQP